MNVAYIRILENNTVNGAYRERYFQRLLPSGTFVEVALVDVPDDVKQKCCECGGGSGSATALKVNNTPIGYVPSASNNTQNLNEVVITATGDKYIIDSRGFAMLVESNQRLNVNLVPLTTTPSATGNISNKNEVVTDAKGDVYIIDFEGDALQIKENTPFSLKPELSLKRDGARHWDATLYTAQGADPEIPATWTLNNSFTIGIRHDSFSLKDAFKGKEIQVWAYHLNEKKHKKRHKDKVTGVKSNVLYLFKNKFVHPQDTVLSLQNPSAWRCTTGVPYRTQWVYSSNLLPRNEGQFLDIEINPADWFVMSSQQFPLTSELYKAFKIHPRGKKLPSPVSRITAAVLKLAFVIPNYRNNKPLILGFSDPLYLYPKKRTFLEPSGTKTDYFVQWQCDFGKRTM
jgi:hypothetical protein